MPRRHRWVLTYQTSPDAEPQYFGIFPSATAANYVADRLLYTRIAYAADATREDVARERHAEGR